MNRGNRLFLQLLITFIVVLICFALWSIPAKAQALNFLGKVAITESLAPVNSRINNPLSFIDNLKSSLPSENNKRKISREEEKVTSGNETWFNVFIKWLFPDRVEIEEASDASRRTAAARRGKCSSLNKPLVALVPSKKKSKASSLEGLESAFGLTVAEFPNFWFYVPSLPSGVNSAEFMLQEFLPQEKKYKDVLERPFTFQVKEGISSFSLQSAGVPLKLGKVYHWYISIICDSQRPSRNPSIDAWVKLVKPSSELSQIETYRDTKERLEFYIQDGIWYETLTLLAKLRCQYQDAELFEAWSSLLQSIGIKEEIARESILSCP